jgi:ribosome-binding protein aMBF1 (putative translation factor)
MNAVAKSQGSPAEFNSFKLAIAVLADRIASLPKEDKDDLFELTKVVFSAETEEERESAMRAMGEIMEQRPLALVKVEDNENEPLSGWLAFISGRIRDERVKAELTQAQLADKAGLTQSHVSRLENGEHSPSAVTIQKIAAALGIKPSQLDPSADE